MPATPHVLLQEITYTWTKASRDPDLAERLRQLPSAVSLPRGVADADTMHKVGYSEHSAFAESAFDVATEPLAMPLRLGCVFVERASAKLAVDYQYRLACGGLPERAAEARHVLLVKGQWLQIMYNGRIPGAEGALWVYFKRIVNVGLTESPTRRDWFVVTAPTLLWDECVAMPL